MNNFKITILGSGTSLGVPMIGCTCRVCKSDHPKDKRMRASVLIQTADKNIVIDTGPDFRMQMLNSGITHLDGVLITHSHKDHIGGMDDVRAFNLINKTPSQVYAEANVIKSIKQEFFYAFEEFKYPGLPEINLHEIGVDPFEVAEVSVVPIRVMHNSLPILGFRVGNFAYITDTSFVPETEYHKFEGVEVLVIDGLRIREHISHFNLQQALAMIDILKPKQAYITHISHQMGLHEEVNKVLPMGVELAYDGLVINL